MKEPSAKSPRRATGSLSGARQATRKLRRLKKVLAAIDADEIYDKLVELGMPISGEDQNWIIDQVVRQVKKILREVL